MSLQSPMHSQNKLNSLANMLSDGDLFDKAFDKGANNAANDVFSSSIGP